ncbi:MAG: hypothetical protein OXU19_10140 [bacterium]|nr:hypothetical protein [bacterium]MDE0242135.1 hypothetical protein [bacterium]
MNLDCVDRERHGCLARKNGVSVAWIDHLALKDFLARFGLRQAVVSPAVGDDYE